MSRPNLRIDCESILETCDLFYPLLGRFGGLR